MESRADVLARTRRRINAAKSRLRKTWEDVFGHCDKDRSGCLELHEFEWAVREMLNVPENGLCRYELKMLFNEIDADGSGGVSLEELMSYLANGYRSPEEIASRAQVRIQRVRRCLKMAFQSLGTNDAQMRKLFVKLDLDSDSSLSLHEFQAFVRMELKLSFWDLTNSDIDEFYKSLDNNRGQGVTVDELLSFVKTNCAGKQPKEFSFMTIAPSGRSQKLAKKKTFKQTLLQDTFRSSSLPDLSRMRYTASVVSLGRGGMPATRSSLSKSSQMFFDPAGPERRLMQP